MKKILILTITAGNGHNACAKGIKNKLENLGGAEVKIIDMLKVCSTKLSAWVADKGYCLSVSKILPIYNMFYNSYRKAKPEDRYSCGSQQTILTAINGVMREILSFEPDVIYCTHYYCAMAITNLRLVYNLPCKAIVSSLDYVLSPFWESCIGVDYFTLPNEDFFEECLYKGFRKEQLLPLGIPVDERTLQVMEKSEARKKLDLDENLFTIMVMFGGGYWSGGLRIFKNLVKELGDRKAQIVMINGKDKKGFNKIAKMKFKHNLKVLNVGFTSEIPTYLSASDVILNKCGGLCATEMVNKGVPMLITEKLPAQETYNLNYMKNKKVAMSFKNAKQLKQHILNLMDNPQFIEDIKINYQPLKKSATEDLAKFILTLPNADYSELKKQNIDYNLTRPLVKKALKKADKESKQQG